MSLVAVGVLEARSCGEKNQLSNGGSLHPGQRVCEPGAMTHTGFVHAPVIPGGDHQHPDVSQQLVVLMQTVSY